MAGRGWRSAWRDALFCLVFLVLSDGGACRFVRAAGWDVWELDRSGLDMAAAFIS